MVLHTIDPVYDSNSEILILGSFPSVKSRELQFFYGHPRNRFWRVISDLYKYPEPCGTQEKKKMLHALKIALWDVIASCEIDRSSDSSIRNVVPNDLKPIIDKAPVKKIFLNGRTAEKYYKLYMADKLKIPAVCLPSTSPANAGCSYDSLKKAWSAVLMI